MAQNVIHASHEQFGRTELPKLIHLAEKAGFDAGAAGRAAGPVSIQHASSWPEAVESALEEEMQPWAQMIAEDEVNRDLQCLADFDRLARLVSADETRDCVAIASDPAWHQAQISEPVEH